MDRTELHPVSYGDGNDYSLEALIATAESAIERAQEPAMVAARKRERWRFDQQEAIEDSSNERLKGILAGDEEYGVREGGDPQHNLKMRAAIMLRAATTVRWACPHTSWPPDQLSRTVVVFSARAATCELLACVEAVRAYHEDNGCCDLCLLPSADFRATVVPIGSFVLAMSLCDSCDELLYAEEKK